MYKVLVFMENEIPKIEEELNQYPQSEVVTTWSTGNRIVFVIKVHSATVPYREELSPLTIEPRKRGRPVKVKEENIAIEQE